MIWLFHMLASPLAFLAGVVAFPIRLFSQPFPALPTIEAFMESMDESDWYKRPFHWLKNILSELFRADPRWWAQCSCFTIAVLIAVAVLT